jgi:DNA repair protein RadC
MNVELTKEQKIKILNSHDLYKVMQQVLLRENKIERDQEHVWAVCLNGSHKILAVELVSLGAINETILTPMQVFRVSILKGAVSMILVHNHTQGVALEPSEEDKDTTDRMIQVGNIVNVKVIDHLIISEKDYYSFKRHGLIEQLLKSRKWVPQYMEEERIRQEAIKIGQERGEKIGEKKGIKKGKIEGIKKGEKQGKIETAKNLINMGIDLETIVRATGLTQKEITSLKK